MPGAWLRPCISRLKPEIVFNSHTRANHPGWGLGRTVSLDKVQRTVGHLASNIIPFLWLYFESSFPKCCTMDAVVMMLSSGHTRGKRIIFCFCYCSYFSRIFVCLPCAGILPLLLLLKDICMSLPYPFTSHGEYVTFGAIWLNLCLQISLCYCAFDACMQAQLPHIWV